MGEKTLPAGFWKKFYWMIVKSENFISHIFLLIIRLYWGAMMAMTGFGKLANIHGVESYFTELGISSPLATAYAVGIIELVGGLSFILGFMSRIFAIPLAVIFIMAYIFGEPTALSQIFIKPSVFISQEPFLYLYAALVVLSFGPGVFSIDYWLEKRSFGQKL